MVWVCNIMSHCLLRKSRITYSISLGFENYFPGLLMLFTPQPLRAVGVLFSPMVSRWVGGRAGGRREEVCPACISESIRSRKLILGRDIG